MGWREEVASLPKLAPAEFDLRGDDTALVIVDMQYVDAHRDYGLGLSLRESHPDLWEYYFDRVESLVVPNTRRLLDAFREHGMRVIHLRLGAELADGADMVRLRRPAQTPGLAPAMHHAGTFEHQILPELTPVEGELVINKTSRSAFNSTAIERVLINLGIRTVVIAGVTTSACVETTARDAADRGYQTVIVEDATAEFDEVSHDATLRLFAIRWGQIWTADEAIETLAGLHAVHDLG